MPFAKKQVVELPFPVNDGIEYHPGVIISDNAVFEAEKEYICVMISSTPKDDVFTFRLAKGDTTNDFPIESQVRMHLIGRFKHSEVVAKAQTNYMTETCFNRLIDTIDVVVFGVD